MNKKKRNQNQKFVEWKKTEIIAYWQRKIAPERKTVHFF